MGQDSLTHMWVLGHPNLLLIPAIFLAICKPCSYIHVASQNACHFIKHTPNKKQHPQSSHTTKAGTPNHTTKQLQPGYLENNHTPKAVIPPKQVHQTTPAAARLPRKQPHPQSSHTHNSKAAALSKSSTDHC